MEVHREARPRAVRSDFRMHDEILNYDRAKAFDGVRDSPEKRGHVSLPVPDGLAWEKCLIVQGSMCS
ncbi:hypothetical protein TPAU25S_00915 [Tsukamurella paurometabola]